MAHVVQKQERAPALANGPQMLGQEDARDFAQVLETGPRIVGDEAEDVRSLLHEGHRQVDWVARRPLPQQKPQPRQGPRSVLKLTPDIYRDTNAGAQVVRERALSTGLNEDPNGRRVGHDDLGAGADL